jgi:hypothetical protein
LLLAAECPSEAKQEATAEAEAFAGAVGALGRHKLGLEPGSSATWMAMMAMAVDSRRITLT